MKESTYKEIYNATFKEIVEDKNGKLIKDQVMRELSDYSVFMDTAAKVYCHVTGGRISKINTLPEAIISVADEYFEEQFEYLKDDIRDEIRDELVQEMKAHDVDEVRRLREEVDRLHRLIAELDHAARQPI